MNMTIYKIFRFIMDLLYPTRCPVCGKFIGYMDDYCSECREKINIYGKTYKIDNSDFSISVCCYDENISQAVYTLKDTAGNAPYAFANGISNLLEENNLVEKIDFIVPIPMHKSDKAKRGFNQCELIAREITRIISIPHRFDVVFKTLKTFHQKNLSQSERRLNLKNSFSIKKPEKVSGKSILVIDDVCTTGSTLAEVSGLLKNYGAKEVYCCTYCKTV